MSTPTTPSTPLAPSPLPAQPQVSLLTSLPSSSPVPKKSNNAFIFLMLIILAAGLIFLIWKSLRQDKRIDEAVRTNSQNLQDQDVEEIIRQFITNKKNKKYVSQIIEPAIKKKIIDEKSINAWQAISKTQKQQPKNNTNLSTIDNGTPQHLPPPPPPSTPTLTPSTPPPPSTLSPPPLPTSTLTPPPTSTLTPLPTSTLPLPPPSLQGSHSQSTS